MLLGSTSQVGPNPGLEPSPEMVIGVTQVASKKTLPLPVAMAVANWRLFQVVAVIWLLPT